MARTGDNRKPPCGVNGPIPFKHLPPFRAWVQMVLPEVYTDALSYQELLYKVLWYLNGMLDDLECMGCEINKLYKAYKQLQDWVNDFFDNLDVQDEIDDKLDRMAADGSLLEIMKPYLEELFYALMTDEYLTELLTPLVDDWLEENASALLKTHTENWLKANAPTLIQDYSVEWLEDNASSLINTWLKSNASSIINEYLATWLTANADGIIENYVNTWLNNYDWSKLIGDYVKTDEFTDFVNDLIANYDYSDIINSYMESGDVTATTIQIINSDNELLGYLGLYPSAIDGSDGIAGYMTQDGSVISDPTATDSSNINMFYVSRYGAMLRVGTQGYVVTTASMSYLQNKNDGTLANIYGTTGDDASTETYAAVVLNRGNSGVYPALSGRIVASGAGTSDTTGADNGCYMNLGTSSYPWDTVYSQNGVSTTSDERHKDNIEDIGNKYYELFMKLRPVQFNFKKQAKTHLGLIAQEVKSSMEEVGLEDNDFAGYLDGDTKCLNYSEFIGLLIGMVQEQEERIQALEDRIAVLQGEAQASEVQLDCEEEK